MRKYLRGTMNYTEISTECCVPKGFPINFAEYPLSEMTPGLFLFRRFDCCWDRKNKTDKFGG